MVRKVLSIAPADNWVAVCGSVGAPRFMSVRCWALIEVQDETPHSLHTPLPRYYVTGILAEHVGDIAAMKHVEETESFIEYLHLGFESKDVDAALTEYADKQHPRTKQTEKGKLCSASDSKLLAYGLIKMVIDERLCNPGWPFVEFGDDGMGDKEELRAACEDVAEELRLLEEDKAAVCVLDVGSSFIRDRSREGRQ